VPEEAVGALLILIGIVAFGAVLGFIGGHAVWFIYGQIQLLLGVYYPYAAMFGPPVYYQIAWTILGAFTILKVMK